MTTKIFFTSKAKNVNFQCLHYRQDRTKGRRWCVNSELFHYVDLVNERSKTGKKLVFQGCRGCRCYGNKEGELSEKHLSNNDIEKIRSGRSIIKEEIQHKQRKRRDEIKEDPFKAEEGELPKHKHKKKNKIDIGDFDEA